jgi:hypothetical protein
MTTQEVAQRLFELCENDDTPTALNELYAENATSTEANMEGLRETISGLNAIREKSKQFMEMIESVHGGYTKPPLVFGNYIFMEMGMDFTMKEYGRMNVSEMAKYEVKDGKIISEEFFY